MPNYLKWLRAKIHRAQHPPPASAPSEDGRLPPGQRWVDNFPVLDLGKHPKISPTEWRLQLSGAIAQPQTLDWQALQALPQRELCVDIHCVTRWSRADVPWQGVAAAELVALAQPLPEAQFVMLHSADGYSANVPLSAILEDDVLLAHSVDGKALTREHGAPVRFMMPKRYFWKSAKWLTGMAFLTEDQAGFWEARAYHNDADPWLEQRYQAQDKS